MRSRIVLVIFAMVCGAWFSGCKKAQVGHQETYTYTIYTPVLEKRADIYAAINGDPNEPIDSAGKIYVKGNFIYINEVDKGIHVIDNSDPSHPFQTAFVRIPGNRDIAIKSNILYADMYAELISINIEDIHHVTITSNLKNIFLDRGIWYADTAGLVIGFQAGDTTVTQMVYPVDDNCANCVYNSASGSKSGGGKAGSMARMVLMDDHLYAIAERHSVAVLNVSEPEAPENISTFNAGFDLETIFPFENKLLLGSATGMFMFDVSDREQPKQLGTFKHGRACDPVIADGDYAYVTLHAGTTCGGDANELNVVNIKDLMNPSLVHAYPMASPKGLSKDGNLLFVCDGGDAVKIFDASNPEKLKDLASLNCPDPYDVITGNQTAMVVAKKGIYQFDYSDPANVRLLSVLTTTTK